MQRCCMRWPLVTWPWRRKLQIIFDALFSFSWPLAKSRMAREEWRKTNMKKTSWVSFLPDSIISFSLSISLQLSLLHHLCVQQYFPVFSAVAMDGCLVVPSKLCFPAFIVSTRRLCGHNDVHWDGCEAEEKNHYHG